MAGSVVGNRNWATPMDNPYGTPDQGGGSTQGPAAYTPPPDSESYTPQHVGTPGPTQATALPIMDTGTPAPGAVMPSTPQAPSLAALSAGSGAPPPTTPAPASSAPMMMDSAPQSNVGMRMPPSLATLLKASIY